MGGLFGVIVQLVVMALVVVYVIRIAVAPLDAKLDRVIDLLKQRQTPPGA